MRPDTNLGVMELSGRIVSYGNDNIYRLTSETIAGDTHSVNGAVRGGGESHPESFFAARVSGRAVELQRQRPAHHGHLRMQMVFQGNQNVKMTSAEGSRDRSRYRRYTMERARLSIFFSYGGAAARSGKMKSAITEEPIPSRLPTEVISRSGGIAADQS
jgi:hypothetical protein